MQLELWGGPFDGERYLRSRRPAAFIWIDDCGAAFTEPREGRHLYRVFSTRRQQGDIVVRYRFAGYEITRCEECGWFGPREDGICVLCNAALPA